MIAVGLLACAFTSAAHRGKTPVSELWLTGWVLIVIHFASLLFVTAPGIWGVMASDAGLAALACAGVLFMAVASFFLYTYRRATAGAFITIAGFFAWAAVFVVAPLTSTLEPGLQIENEVWNLPKFVVAVGMILLLFEEQIEHNKYLALHDELTGLPNRRLFLDRLALALERARRTGARSALLVVDLDLFKQVNDTFGHHASGRLLKQVGEIFIDRVRRSDTVARTGGDEFSVLIEEPITGADAEHESQSLTQLLNEPLQVNNHLVRVGASIGVAIFPDDAADQESLYIAADL